MSWIYSNQLDLIGSICLHLLENNMQSHSIFFWIEITFNYINSKNIKSIVIQMTFFFRIYDFLLSILILYVLEDSRRLE